MKYKELPAFETNEFEIGDKIKCYDSCTNTEQKHSIVRIIKDFVEIETQEFISGIEVHFSTCRKLEPVKPREWTVWIQDGDIQSRNPFIPIKDPIKVREVIEE